MKIIAKFTGQNESMGLYTGVSYILKIWQEGQYVIVQRNEWERIHFRCPYQNIETFLQNWTEIKVLEK